MRLDRRKVAARVIITYAVSNINTYQSATGYLHAMSRYCSTTNACPTTNV